MVIYQLYSTHILAKIPNLGSKGITNSGKFNIKMETGEEIIVIRHDIY